MSAKEKCELKELMMISRSMLQAEALELLDKVAKAPAGAKRYEAILAVQRRYEIVIDGDLLKRIVIARTGAKRWELIDAALIPMLVELMADDLAKTGMFHVSPDPNPLTELATS